ncbi:MAG: hypothetical protein LBT14_00965 [Treponema sp.]|jgi:hypothetical protein|nr:hypothetical protein [Treponema sp.]
MSPVSFNDHELFVEFLRDFIKIDMLNDIKSEQGTGAAGERNERLSVSAGIAHHLPLVLQAADVPSVSKPVFVSGRCVSRC